jgi:hypothetical protein
LVWPKHVDAAKNRDTKIRDFVALKRFLKTSSIVVSSFYRPPRPQFSRNRFTGAACATRK